MENFVFNPINNKKPSGACCKGTTVTYELKVIKFVGIKKAYFVMHQDGQDEQRYEMTHKYADDRYYHLEFSHAFLESGFFWYHFEVETNEGDFKLIRSDNLDVMQSPANSDFLQLVISKESKIDNNFKIIYR